jgi:phytoene synthase
MSTEATTTAREIQKMFGSNYYAATLLLPKGVREDVFVFYSFARLADEIVDNPSPGTDPAQKLQEFTAAWERTFHSNTDEDIILTAFAKVCKRRKIAYSLTVDFLAAMQKDLSTTRYETYGDLQKYMYGSAEVIGLVLLRIFECDDPVATAPARAMGEAMQLSNFLRDISDDYHTRDRIYVPRQDMERFSVSEEALMATPSSQPVRALIEYECKRNHEIYEAALKGIQLLPKSAQRAVRVAAALYREIIREIERGNYQVRSKKIRFSKLKKLQIALVYGYVKK